MYGAWVHLYNGWWILRRRNGEMVLGRRRSRIDMRVQPPDVGTHLGRGRRAAQSAVGGRGRREERRPHIARHLTVEGSRSNSLLRSAHPLGGQTGSTAWSGASPSTRQVGRNPSGGGPSMMATYDVSLEFQLTPIIGVHRSSFIRFEFPRLQNSHTGCQRLSRQTHASKISFTGYIK